MQANPNWLIFVEGVDCYQLDCSWWGSNLEGVSTAPVNLSVPNHLVYSVHEYPASVSPPGVKSYPWYNDPNYPNNLSQVWDTHWGYIQKQGIAPVWVGEFGTKLQTNADRQWLTALVRYLGTGSGGINRPTGRGIPTRGYWRASCRMIGKRSIRPSNNPSIPFCSRLIAMLLTQIPTYLRPRRYLTRRVSLKLGYEVGKPGTLVNQIMPNFRLTNVSQSSIDLK